jgi:hypothetical protein
MRHLRHNPAFLRLWAANLFSSLGGWALGIALSVHIFELTRSPLATSALLVAGTVPRSLLEVSQEWSLTAWTASGLSKLSAGFES